MSQSLFKISPAEYSIKHTHRVINTHCTLSCKVASNCLSSFTSWFSRLGHCYTNTSLCLLWTHHLPSRPPLLPKCLVIHHQIGNPALRRQTDHFLWAQTGKKDSVTGNLRIDGCAMTDYFSRQTKMERVSASQKEHELQLEEVSPIGYGLSSLVSLLGVTSVSK